jgi:hypothetical protein
VKTVWVSVQQTLRLAGPKPNSTVSGFSAGRPTAAHRAPERWPVLPLPRASAAPENGVGDARAPRYRKAFDLVVSFNALHWVPEQEAGPLPIRATLSPAAEPSSNPFLGESEQRVYPAQSGSAAKKPDPRR